MEVGFVDRTVLTGELINLSTVVKQHQGRREDDLIGGGKNKIKVNTRF